MKVALVNYSDARGGAARAAYRQFQALRKNSECDVNFFAVHRQQNDTLPLITRFGDRASFYYDNLVDRSLTAFRKGEHKKVSLNYGADRHRLDQFFPTYDVVHIHWVHNATISIRELQSFKHPLVWTLHDAWMFNAPYHLPQAAQIPGEHFRSAKNALKSLAEKQNFTFVFPSSWGLEEFERKFGHGHRAYVVPNAVNFEDFYPDGAMPSSTRHIVFAANNGAHDLNKGFDLLRVALEDFAFADIKLHIVGDVWSGQGIRGIEIVNHGFVSSAKQLRQLYSNASIVCVPSRFEMFGQVAAEALACGTPVVAFRVSGLTGVVDHNVTGLLANPLSPEDLRTAIAAALNRWPKSRITQKYISDIAQRKFSAASVSAQLQEIYRTIHDA